jgi:hypothetical protein
MTLKNHRPQFLVLISESENHFSLVVGLCYFLSEYKSKISEFSCKTFLGS